jgi:hypothetical protein
MPVAYNDLVIKHLTKQRDEARAALAQSGAAAQAWQLPKSLPLEGFASQPSPAATVEIPGFTIDALRKQAFRMPPADQFKLACFIAENVGYVLAPEQEHPDSPHNGSSAVSTKELFECREFEENAFRSMEVQICGETRTVQFTTSDHGGDHPTSPSVAIDWSAAVDLATWIITHTSTEPQGASDTEVFRKLLRTAQLLQQNSEGCAVNHHGLDFEQQGLPGWLADTQKAIDEAASALALPLTRSGRG